MSYTKLSFRADGAERSCIPTARLPKGPRPEPTIDIDGSGRVSAHKTPWGRRAQLRFKSVQTRYLLIASAVAAITILVAGAVWLLLGFL
jgi:hypothetical protein